MFLDQLIKTLRVEQSADLKTSRQLSGSTGGKQPDWSDISVSAALHGRELMKQGFTIDQVVHDYGDLCQAITELAFEDHAQIEVDEFRTLNRCLDNAIADAVTEFSHQRDVLVANQTIDPLDQRRKILAHELSELIHTATLAVTAIKAGNVGLAGATGAVLDRSLLALRILVDRSFADVLPPAPRKPH